MPAVVSLYDEVDEGEVIALYQSNQWSSAAKPEQLLPALRNSHSLATARIGGALVGIANAISDGHLVVYFPHMLVHPRHHRQGIGRRMVELLMTRYERFHQVILTADGDAVKFYESVGFVRAGSTVPMWIYAGNEHS